MNTTTIEITQNQKEALDTFKNAESESYKEVLQRIIDHYSENGDSGVDEEYIRNISRDEAESVVNDRVIPKALE